MNTEPTTTDFETAVYHQRNLNNFRSAVNSQFEKGLFEDAKKWHYRASDYFRAYGPVMRKHELKPQVDISESFINALIG